MTKKYALIGSGPAGSGVIEGMAKNADRLAGCEIHIFDPLEILGAGGPYDWNNNDFNHLLNVPSKSISVPEDFYQWIVENGAKKEKFREMIEQEKFAKLEKCAGDEAKQQEVHEQYQKMWESFETRDLKIDDEFSYHPRILYGLYAVEKFQQNVEKLRAAGATVVLHPSTEAISLDQENNLGFRDIKTGAIAAEKFDEVVVATGHWHESDGLEGDRDNRYIPHAYPSSEMNERLAEIIQTEIAHGKKDVYFAIEGSSLSAIDALKSIYREGEFKRDENGKLHFTPSELDGVTIHVDMISRGGEFQAVKGNFVRSAETRAKYPQLTQKNVDELAKENGGKFCLWQLMHLVCDHILKAYTASGAPQGNDERMAGLQEFIKLLDDHGKKLPEKTNYKPIFGALSQLASRGIRDPFEKLALNLHEAESGDSLNGTDLIWQIIYAPVDEFSLSKYLPTEEKILRFKFLDRMHRAHAESMPPESAHELLAIRESGNFRVLNKDIRSKRVNEAGYINFGNDDVDYAAVIDTTGQAFNVEQNSSPLFQSMVRNNMIFSMKEKFCSAAEYDDAIADLENRFGEIAERIKPSLPRPKDGSDCFYDRAFLDMNNDRQALTPNGELACPNVRFLLETGGINSAYKKGVAIADKLLGIIATPSVAQATATQPVHASTQTIFM